MAVVARHISIDIGAGCVGAFVECTSTRSSRSEGDGGEGGYKKKRGGRTGSCSRCGSAGQGRAASTVVSVAS